MIQSDAKTQDADVAEYARAERWEKLLNVLLPISAVIGFVLLWTLAVAIFQIPEYLLPSPIDIVKRIAEDWPIYLDHGFFTLKSVLLGFFASMVCGALFATAIVLHWNKLLAAC